MNRDNTILNNAIKEHIKIWNGTVHGQLIKTAWEKGAEYEQICKICGMDYNNYKDLVQH